jgi:hypothetical protein
MNGKWNVDRVLLVLTFAVSLLASVFGLGVNWARITQTESDLKAFEVTYLRADVYAADQRRLSESLDRLSQELKAMREQARPNQTPLGRMFDR